MRYTWHEFTSTEAVEKYVTQQSTWYTYITKEWRGPGWYVVGIGSKRCPRGCCDEGVLNILPAALRADEIAEEMKELADELRLARERAKETAPVAIE